MRRSLLLGIGVLLLLIMGAIWLGCGGGRASTMAVNLTLTPIAASLNRGATAQIAVTALDANNVAVAAPPLAFHSSNPAAITVSPAGLICAGQWDASFVNCYACSNPDLITNQCPANGGNVLPLGTANITATASTGNVTITSNTVVVTDHEPIDSVQVSMSGSNPTCAAPVTACVSQNGTAPFTLQAFSHDPQACARLGYASTPCPVPSDTVGSVNWAVSPGQVATTDAAIHTATDPVCVTASAPGQGVVAGSVGVAGSTVSGSSAFLTCAVASIHVHQQNTPTPPDTETSFTAPIGGTVPLVADVFDSNNNPVTNTLALTWLTSQPALAGVSQSTSQGATVQALAPGTASISAACLPPSCNVNFVPLEPVYSDNVVTANITGTTDSTVLATTSTPPANTSSSNNIVSIDTTTNTAGTTFTLPENLVVNSMVIAPTGDPVFLGTTCTAGTTIAANGLACSGLLRFDPTVGTVPGPTTTITGSVLTTDGNRVVVSDPTTSQVFIVTAAGPSVEATPLINVSSLIAPSTAAPPGATESGTTVTLTTTTPHGLAAGQSVIVAGVGVAGYNGVYKVDSVIGDPTSSTSFTYTDPNAGLAASGGGYVTGGVSAAIAPDASKIFIVTGQGSPQSPPGGTLHVYRTGLPVISKQRSGGVESIAPTSTQAVSFFPTSLMAYIANSGAGVDDLVALSPLPPDNCNNDDIVSSIAVGNSPTHIAAIPNTGLSPFSTSIPAMVDANSPNIDEIDVEASSASVCPLALTKLTSTPNGFTGVNSFTAKQLLVTPNSKLAIILTSDQGVLVYNVGSPPPNTSVVTLTGSPAPQPLSGGVTPDSASLYVGASDGKVHRIDLTKTPPADAQSIAVSLCPSVPPGCNPDFVVVRPVATVATLTSLAITAPGNATPNAPKLNVGGTQQFKATGTFSDKTTRDMTNFVTWASSNQVVAVIGINTAVTPPLTTPGLARALATGTTTISATSAGVTGSIGLTVQ